MSWYLWLSFSTAQFIRLLPSQLEPQMHRGPLPGVVTQTFILKGPESPVVLPLLLLHRLPLIFTIGHAVLRDDLVNPLGSQTESCAPLLSSKQPGLPCSSGSSTSAHRHTVISMAGPWDAAKMTRIPADCILAESRAADWP